MKSWDDVKPGAVLAGVRIQGSPTPEPYTATELENQITERKHDEMFNRLLATARAGIEDRRVYLVRDAVDRNREPLLPMVFASHADARAFVAEVCLGAVIGDTPLFRSAEEAVDAVRGVSMSSGREDGST